MATLRDPPAAGELIERAVELAQRYDEHAKHYGTELRRKVEKLDSAGAIRESTDMLYAIRPRSGELEFDLPEFDGRAPISKELRTETRRRESFDEDARDFLLNR